MAMDCTYRLRIPHHSGQLAKVATRISEYGGLIGDVTTIMVALREALRERRSRVRRRRHERQ
jgi:malate dehydrogenase (oxaloacetate-decarboxylating)